VSAEGFEAEGELHISLLANGRLENEFVRQYLVAIDAERFRIRTTASQEKYTECCFDGQDLYRLYVAPLSNMKTNLALYPAFVERQPIPPDDGSYMYGSPTRRTGICSH
jgi:hypothetical protein